MPFQSEKQRRYLWMNHPVLARRWTNEYGSKVVQKKVYDRLDPKKGKKNVRRSRSS